jgi:hypothetical protein
MGKCRMPAALRAAALALLLVVNLPQPIASATPTPDSNAGLLAWNATCPTPPCDLGGAIPVAPSTNDPGPGGGLKTVSCSTVSGEASIDVVCKVAGSVDSPEVVLATLTGSDCETPGNCVTTVSTWCDRLHPRITVCSSCAVSCWFRQDHSDQ